jgi:hypothetical protein
MNNELAIEVEKSVEEVRKIFEDAVNCLETAKVMYGIMPQDIVEHYCHIIPYLRNVPLLYQMAIMTNKKEIEIQPPGV